MCEKSKILDRTSGEGEGGLENSDKPGQGEVGWSENLRFCVLSGWPPTVQVPAVLDPSPGSSAYSH